MVFLANSLKTLLGILTDNTLAYTAPSPKGRVTDGVLPINLAMHFFEKVNLDFIKTMIFIVYVIDSQPIPLCQYPEFCQWAQPELEGGGESISSTACFGQSASS